MRHVRCEVRAAGRLSPGSRPAEPQQSSIVVASTLPAPQRCSIVVVRLGHLAPGMRGLGAGSGVVGACGGGGAPLGGGPFSFTGPRNARPPLAGSVRGPEPQAV